MYPSLFYLLLQYTVRSDDLGRQFYASRDGCVEEVVSLLARGAPVNWRDESGRAALHAYSMLLQQPC